MPRGRSRDPAGNAGRQNIGDPRSQTGRVSGPLSASPPSQPRINPSSLVAPAQTQGDRQARQNIQQGAPTSPQSPQSSSQPSQSPSPGGSPIPGGFRDVLTAPSTRPNEPITEGVPVGPGSNGFTLLPQDPDELLKAAYMIYPDPALLRLMQDYNVQ